MLFSTLLNKGFIASVPLMVVVFLSLLVGGFAYQQYSKYQNNPADQPQQFDPNEPELQVLGSNDGFIGGVISQTSLQEPKIEIQGRNVSGEVSIDVYKATADEIVQYLVYNEDGYQVQPTVSTEAREKVISTTVDLSGDAYWTDSGTITLPVDGVGIWLIEASKGDTSDQMFLVRSKVTTLLKEGDGKYVAWTQDLETKRSVDTGEIKLYNLENSAKLVATAVIESEGITSIPLTGGIDIGVVQSRDSTAILPIDLKYLNYGYSSYDSFSPKKINNNAFLFTDRPLYKPGDTIYFKVIARDDDDAKYSIPTGTAHAILYRGHQDQPIAEKHIPITSDGTVYGEFVLPEGIKTGGYSLQVDFENDSDSWFGGSYDAYRYIQVEHYRKPEYTITVDSTQDAYVSGDSATIVVSGEYFFGEPLTDGYVSYTVTSAEFWDYSYYSDIASRLDNEYWYGGWYGKQVSSGSSQFDDAGYAYITIDTTLPEKETESKIYTIEATYQDASGDPVVDKKNILVSRGEFSLYQKDRLYSSIVGKPVDMTLKAVSRSNTGTSNKELTAKLTRHDWERYQDQHDTKDPTVKRTGWSYREIIDKLPDITTTTNQDGEATFSFTPDKQGTYKLEISATDDRGNTIVKEVSLWVREPGKPYYSGSSQDTGLTISPDQQEYNHTDTAALTIHTDIADRDVFLSFDRAYMHRYQVVNISGNDQTVHVDLQESDMPNIFAKVASFGPEGFDTNRTDLTISTDPKKLVTKITPDRDIYGPGDTVELTINTTDYQGNPISADTAVWAVDKAIFELVDQDGLSLFDTFWHTRWDNTRETHSLQDIRANPAEMGGGCFTEDTQVLMHDGSTKSIKDVQIGDIVLTKETEHSDTLVEAIVSDTFKHSSHGHFIINQTLRVTPEHRMWINNMWQEAYYIQQGDMLLDSKGNEVFVESIEWQAGTYDVYNLEIDTYQTYFAGGVWVHNQKGGGGRSIFKDTAYWNPSVRTDSNGNATVTFTIPDNLTTWVLSAVGSTVDTKLGTATNEITVRKNVVVRPSLPNILRIGDTNKIISYVHNYTDNDQAFMLSGEFDAGTITLEGSQSIAVKAKEAVKTTWIVTPETATDASRLTFSATATGRDDLSDTVTKEVPVWTYGYWKKYGDVGNGETTFDIQLSQGSDPNDSYARISLSPSLLGTLPNSMNYLVQYPYGCVEQTTSRFVPGVIAREDPELFGSALVGKDIDDMLQKGVTRLGNLQNNSGGWSWWSSSDTNPFITAYVVEYIYRAKQLGTEVDPVIIESVTNYLSSALQNGATGEKRVAILYAMSILDIPEGFETAPVHESYTPDIIALAVMHNVRIGKTDPEESGLSLLLEKAQKSSDGNYVYWEPGKPEFFGSKEASTALSMRAMSAADADQDTITAAARYLLSSRKSEYWANSFATAQVIQAVVDNAKATSELSGSYTYTVALDDKTIAAGTVSDYKTIIDDVIIAGETIKPSGSAVQITKSSQVGQLYSSLITHEYHTDTEAEAENEGLIVVRDYHNADGSDTIQAGDTVTVTLKIRNSTDNNSGYTVLEDQLPSGFVPINTAFKNVEQDNSRRYSYRIAAQEFTKNGVIVGIRNWGSDDFYYSYKARVVNEGTFHAPPTTASLMYAPEITGHSDAHTITISSNSSQISPKRPSNEFDSATARRFTDDIFDSEKGSNADIYIVGGILLALSAIILLVVFRRRLPLPLREKLSQARSKVSHLWKKQEPPYWQ